MSIDYTLWPNSNGNLGEIKVQIPTNAEDWPEGDALVGNFVYHKGKLVSFVDTKALIANESKSTTFPYDYVNIQVDKSLEGVMTFNGGNAKYFTVNYAETSNSGDTIVLGTKYANCRTVEEVVTIDPDYITNDIVDGVWNQSLEKLEKEYPGESVVYGSGMFSNCSNLTTFTSDLSSLIKGSDMFSRSKLTPQSVMYIVDSIKDIVAEKKLYQDGTAPYVTLADGKYSSTKGFMSDGNYVYTYNRPQPYTTTISASSVGNLTIGINVTNDSATIQQQLQAFAEEAARDNWADLKQDFVNKGWTVAWRYGGTGISITYDMRGDRAIPCPIYAQLEEVEDKDLAEYANEEGTKFYNINWGHDVTNYDDFQQFDSLEDAAAQMRLTKIGEVEIETV